MLPEISLLTQPEPLTERGQGKKPEHRDVDIAFQRIWVAIASHKLLPGTRLKEEELCEALGISRGFVRILLRQLEHHKLIAHVPHSGAFVAEPTREEAREVFRARRLIELELVGELATRCTPQNRVILEQHAKLEQEAHHTGDLGTRIRLAGEFHLLIGALAKRPVLYPFLQEIISRSLLIVALYQQPRSSNGCIAGNRACTEHHTLIEAIASRDVASATALMETHLNELEKQLSLDPEEKQQVDLRSIFS